MNNSKSFLIHWYGPFKGENSLEDLKDWESTQNIEPSLYLIKGYKKYAKITNHFYIGKTIQGVSKRFANQGHHINELSRISEIWVGHFDNLEPNNKEILLAEQMLISYVGNEVGEQNILNKICLYVPSQNVYILSEWYNYKNLKRRERINKNSIAKLVPDVIAYRVTDDNQPLLYISEKLKKYWY